MPVIIIIKFLLPSSVPGKQYRLIFHQCSLTLLPHFPPVSVNLYPLRELDTIGTGRMDLIITDSGLPQPYPMHQFTNPSPSHLPLSSSSQMYTPLYFANSRKQRQGNTQGIWQEQCTIYCTAMLLKIWFLRP